MAKLRSKLGRSIVRMAVLGAMEQRSRLWRRRATTPLGTLLRGLLAGAVGAGVQALFFKATRRLTPPTPEDAFTPPEPEQQGERSTETVARRAVERLAARGPLDQRAKQRAADVVHYGFGAAWGALYGLARETFPRLRGAAGALAFGTVVWIVSDDVILPVFRLAAWPARYPARTHAYAWAAHLPFSAGVELAYEALRPASIGGAALGLWLFARRWRARRFLSRVTAAGVDRTRGAARFARRRAVGVSGALRGALA